jgi:hypothetical protein
MKNITQPVTKKVVKQFDNELKKILLVDLKDKSRFVPTPVMQLTTASAA